MKITERKLNQIIKEEMDNVIKTKEVFPLDESNVQEIKEELKTALQAMVPWSSVGISNLGGKHRPSIMFNISLDPKEEWSNGIYQNSRFAQFSLSYDGRAECFAGGERRKGWKFRSTKVKNVQDLLRKLQVFVDIGKEI